ncbi:hypothetical protein [Thiomonas intermedia]|uniref:hypothetical protein n=1 Tax=Thiomonas intermedia TaxID=926 RepID=UPI001474C6DD|nr:hypothetical protein [Thiomonas intermedia]
MIAELEARARAALPPEAAALLAAGLEDAADAWLAQRLGKSVAQMRSLRRRERRARTVPGAPLVEIGFGDVAGELIGIETADPLAILEAAEAVAALDAQALADADAEAGDEAGDTLALAAALGCTRRRVQQCLAARRELRQLGQCELGLQDGKALLPPARPRALKPRRRVLCVEQLDLIEGGV